MTLKARIRAIDRFIKGLKEDNIYTDLNAACVMAGWDSLAGALTPLKGSAPTNNGLSGYDRGGIGIAGDGTSYLNTNRLNSADGQEDKHIACFVTSPNLSAGENVIGSLVRSPALSVSQIFSGGAGAPSSIYINSSTLNNSLTYDGSAGLFGASRTGTDLTARVSGVSSTVSSVTNDHHALPTYVFCRNDGGTANSFCDGSIAFYSIGSATGLAALDTRVSTLMADLRAIEETGFDRDAIAYIRAVEEADGAFLETDVKIAVNNLVAGLKADGLWDAIGSSCLLCGPRTLAGALVPLRGDAPTAYGGWASGDYDRSTGLEGDGEALYLDTNFIANTTGDDDHHASVYLTVGDAGGHIEMGYATATSYVQFLGNNSNNRILYYLGTNSSIYPPSGIGLGNATGFVGLTADSTSSFDFRFNETTGTATTAATQSLEAENYFVFARNNAGTADAFAESRIAFYSIGTSVDLAKLDTHISDYVTAIGAAL